jgi:chaperonin GroEL (HSP60 family)
MGRISVNLNPGFRIITHQTGGSMKTMTRAALAVAAVFVLGGCQQALDQLARDLDALNGTGNPGAPRQPVAGGGAAMSEAVRTYKTQVDIPNDPKVSAAFDEALPTIKKVLGMQQCMPKINDANAITAQLNQLNQYTIPSFDASANYRGWHIQQGSIPMWNVTYHNTSKCLAVQAIDSVALLAANAISIRAIYISTESHEMVKFKYEFQKWSDGSWRLRQYGRMN